MSWSIQGRYFENCTCDVVCPCSASLALGADNDRCQAVLAFHVDSGEVDGVDVGDLTVVAVADTPKFMHEGGWRLGVLVDDRATDEQAAKLGAVFGGQVGGPMEGLVPLIAEDLGVQRVAMEFVSEGGRHRLTMEGVGELETEDVVPFGTEEGAEPVRLEGAFHPAGSRLTIGKAGGSTFTAFGLEPALAGQSAFSAAFSWSG